MYSPLAVWMVAPAAQRRQRFVPKRDAHGHRPGQAAKCGWETAFECARQLVQRIQHIWCGVASIRCGTGVNWILSRGRPRKQARDDQTKEDAQMMS